MRPSLRSKVSPWLRLSVTATPLMLLVTSLLTNGCKYYRVSAYSFVPRSSARTASSTDNWRKHADSMTMKKRPPMPIQDIPSDGEIPQNLKRKVVARRQLRGDIVPQKGRQKGGTSEPKLRPQGKSLQTSNQNNPSNLKILGGSARGRHLSSPTVFLRPMMGKVREAVYSTFTSFGLYDEGVCTRHLDIFSGSGSVGLESLSRGAQHCTFVDLSRDCCDAIERNVDRCDFGDVGVTRVVCGDALEALRNPSVLGIPEEAAFNIITLCPPYEEITYADLLDAVVNTPLLTEDTIVLVEYPTELGCLPHVLRQESGGMLVGVRNRRYGRTVIAMYIANPTGRLETAESRPEEFISL